MDKTTEKINLTVASETVDWLQDTYPDALTEQEAIRDAIADARRIHQDASSNSY